MKHRPRIYYPANPRAPHMKSLAEGRGPSPDRGVIRSVPSLQRTVAEKAERLRLNPWSRSGTAPARWQNPQPSA